MSDPFSQYGGAADDSTADPFAKYGGAVLDADASPADVAPKPLSGPVNNNGVPVPRELQGPGTGQVLQSAGRVLFGNNPVRDTLSNVGAHLKNDTYEAGKSLAKAVVTPPQNTGETIANTLMPGGLAAYRTLLEPSVDAFKRTRQEYSADPDSSAWTDDAVRSVPVLGPAVVNFADEATNKGLVPALAGAATDVGTAKLLSAGAGAVANLSKGEPLMPGSVGSRWKPKTSAAVVPQAEQAGSGLARAINPTVQLAPGDEEALTAQTPGIKEYAARTGNPLSTRWEFVKAAEGHGGEYRQLWQDQVLGPTQSKSVTVANGQKMTLGEIDHRISDINADLRTDNMRPNEARQFTSQQARDMRSEAGRLNEILASHLSDATGLTPAEIKQIRMGYGQSRAIDQFTDFARRAPGGAPSALPHSKAGLISAAADAAQGGRSAIAERAFQDALRTPGLEAAPQSPIAGFGQRIASKRGADAAAAEANRAAAQQEFLHGNQLDQEAQQAAQQRAGVASSARDANNAAARSAAQQEVLHAHDLSTGAQDAATARGRQAAIERDAVRNETGQVDQAPFARKGIYRLPMDEQPLPNPGDRAGWRNQELNVGAGRSTTLGEEGAPLSASDEARFQVHNINAAVESGNTFNATKWRAQNPGGDVESAKTQAKDLGYKIKTPAVPVKYKGGKPFVQNSESKWWEPQE